MGLLCLSRCLFRFLARILIVSVLLKAGLEIALINKQTPTAIVQRTHMFLWRLQEYIFVDQDIVMRFVMRH